VCRIIFYKCLSNQVATALLAFWGHDAKEESEPWVSTTRSEGDKVKGFFSVSKPESLGFLLEGAIPFIPVKEKVLMDQRSS